MPDRRSHPSRHEGRSMTDLRDRRSSSATRGAASAMDIGEMRAFAEEIGLDETPCRSCRDIPLIAADADRGAGCADCGGTGRLWLANALSLSDAGLSRLAGIVRKGR
jgi:hypothetical protein